MATIAQLTDLHLLEDSYADRPFGPRARLSYLSFGRRLDPHQRKRRAADALQELRAKSVDHLLITGDLTEDGHLQQFEVLAELLSESGMPAERITLVPGNHDAYTDGGAFAAALRGPLKPYAATSSIGAVLRFRDVTIVPVSTAFHQSPLLSAGAIAPEELESLASIAEDPSLVGQPLVFAQHHPPNRLFVPLLQWIDGLAEHAVLSDLFHRCPHLHVVHGHTHHEASRATHTGQAPRVFSASAVVDGGSSLRLYEASPAGLLPLEVDPTDGSVDGGARLSAAAQRTVDESAA
jgi:3',5'-cyclic-AMP phosphodiesterase